MAARSPIFPPCAILAASTSQPSPRSIPGRFVIWRSVAGSRTATRCCCSVHPVWARRLWPLRSAAKPSAKDTRCCCRRPGLGRRPRQGSSGGPLRRALGVLCKAQAADRRRTRVFAVRPQRGAPVSSSSSPDVTSAAVCSSPRTGPSANGARCSAIRSWPQPRPVAPSQPCHHHPRRQLPPAREALCRYFQLSQPQPGEGS